MKTTQAQPDSIFEHHPLAMILVPEFPQSPIANKAALKALAADGESTLELSRYFSMGELDIEGTKLTEITQFGGPKFEAILSIGETQFSGTSTKVVSFADITGLLSSDTEIPELNEIAHDINNPLTVISVNANLISSAKLDDESIRIRAQKIIDATNRCADTVRKLGDLANS